MTAEEITRGIWLKGKTALITGANSGLGFETMRVLAMRGAHVIAACRTMEKAERTCALIAGKSTPLECDLSRIASVTEAVNKVKELNRPIDMLICNAGVMGYLEPHRKDGIELQLLTNHFGHFALVKGLLPVVEQAQQGRIVIVSSEMHRHAPGRGIKFEDLKYERGYNPYRAYAQSKLANMLFMSELARRVTDTNVTVNAVHPGNVQTGITKNGPKLLDNLSQRFGHFVLRSLAQGAATQCYVATNEKLRRVNGYYFANCNKKTPSRLARDEKLAQKLWGVSENFIEQAMARLET